jgi:DNA-binding CsgD family transcriptional regulator
MPRSLTAAERAVALLALRGLTNRDIARLRRVSTRTVANQLASVFRKMGVGSRRELVARMGAAG